MVRWDSPVRSATSPICMCSATRILSLRAARAYRGWPAHRGRATKLTLARLFRYVKVGDGADGRLGESRASAARLDGAPPVLVVVRWAHSRLRVWENL